MARPVPFPIGAGLARLHGVITILRLLLVGSVAYGAIALLTYLLAERVLFQPPPPSYTGALVPFTRVAVGDRDTLAVQYLPNPDARFTILYSHGNAEDLGYLQPIFAQLVDAGFAVVAYDYRGYGQSTGGRPTVRKAVDDAVAVYRYAVHELAIPPGRLILHGRSLGSGPTLELAARYDAAGVVLESAFVSVLRVITRVRVFPFDHYSNLDRVRSLDQPLLVIHGTRDRVIPPWHGRRLYDAAPGPKWAVWVEGAGHNDLAMVAGADHGRAVAEFARRLRGS
jgi:abhydrolase domain-containing protein 17